jgi:hypothetical protein
MMQEYSFLGKNPAERGFQKMMHSVLRLDVVGHLLPPQER